MTVKYGLSEKPFSKPQVVQPDSEVEFWLCQPSLLRKLLSEHSLLGNTRSEEAPVSIIPGQAHLAVMAMAFAESPGALL